MSNAYDAEDEVFDPTDFILNEQRASRARVFASLQDDPEKAARTAQLARATGDDPRLIYPDLENYDQQTKVRITNDLLNSNRYLRQYVDSNFLGDKISNDDYGQLDAVSEKVQKLSSPGVLQAFSTAFKENFDIEKMDADLRKLDEYLYNTGVLGHVLTRRVIETGAAALEVSTKAFGAAVAGISAASGAAAQQLGASPAWSNRLARDVNALIQANTAGAQLIRAPLTPAVKQQFREAKRAQEIVEPYIRVGEEPPTGVHPIVDEAKARQRDIDLENLREALKESEKSATRERDPELFARFIAEHGDNSIRISIDAVMELYGDKLPTADDGVLGWVPRLTEQIEAGLATGADIVVPVKDLLARADSKVIKQIEDHIRTREGGITKFEEEALKSVEQELAPELTPVGVARSAAALDPLLPKGKRKHTLVEGDHKGDDYFFAVVDESGRNIADLSLSVEEGGKRLYINDITGDGANAAGPKAMRDVLEQLKEKFPDAESIMGERVSGARWAGVGKGKPEPSSKASRTEVKLPKPRKRPVQLELNVTRMEDREAFEKAAAMGITEKQYKTYMKLIAEQVEADQKFAAQIGLEKIRRQQTDQWKENERIEREEAARDIKSRPDIAADRYLRTGELGDVQLDKPRIGTDFLTDEQREALPPSFVGKNGLSPDDIAAQVGFETGQQMIQALAELKAARGEKRYEDFIRGLIKEETDRRMEEKYGSLDANVLEQAKDHVLSEGTIDLLHEETLALATQAGLEYSIKKADLRAAIEDVVSKMRWEDVSSKMFLDRAGTAGRAAEDALLKGDYAEAFRQKQRQNHAVISAKFVRQIEKEEKKFNRLVERLGKREPKGVEADFRDYMQALLASVGGKVNPVPEQLRDAIGRKEYESFAAFVEHWTRRGWELDVTDAIAHGEFRRLDQMSVQEWREFNAALQSLNEVGRRIEKINLLNEEFDLADVRNRIITNLETRKIIPPDKHNKLRWVLDSNLVRMEEIVKDIDLREELGPMWSAVIRPVMEAKNREYRMLTDLSKNLAKLGKFDTNWMKTLNDTIPNDFFYDPYLEMNFDLTRADMINIALNFGNRSNIKKFTHGWMKEDKPGANITLDEKAQMFETQLRQMFDKHMRKEDWEFVQRIWDMFEEWRKQGDDMYERLGGVSPKWNPPQEIVTPFGTFRGGHFPIIYDRLRGNIGTHLDRAEGADTLFLNDYIKATTGRSWTRERTGYVDRVQFQNTTGTIIQRMEQIIHDLAMREAVIEASKIIYDKPIRAAIRKHYGEAYEKQLSPWLRDVANHFNQEEQKVSGINAIMRWTRMNLITYALPLNVNVLASPMVGALNPAALMRTIGHKGVATEVAYAHSKEIPNTYHSIDRDYREKLEANLEKQGFGGARGAALKTFTMFTLKIEQGMRINTFYEEFTKRVAKGMDEADAAAIADSIVRQRHGAAGTPDLPAIMRSTEAMKLWTTFYGVFNVFYNGIRQLPGQVKAMDFGAALQTYYTYIFLPSLFGALLFNKESEEDKQMNWFARAGKALLKAHAMLPMQAIPFGREAATYFWEGWAPGTPWGSLLKAVGDMAKDIEKVSKRKEPEKIIKHGAAILGLVGGVPGTLQMGRSGQFIYDVSRGRQKPKNVLDWARGLAWGELEPKRR